jgi:DNA-binding CsgD family transcriptional regulator
MIEDNLLKNSALSIHLHEHLEGLMTTTSANVYWKGRDGRYLGVNDEFIAVSGIQTHHNIVGSTDMDQPWYEQAAMMMQHDRDVVTSKKTKTIIEQALCPAGKIIHFLSHKSPLRNKLGKVIGTLGLSFDLDNDRWNHDTLSEITLLTGIRGGSIAKQYLHQKQLSLFTKRQREIISQVLRGKTAIEIGYILHLSHRTVENYIAQVKEILDVKTKSAVIEKLFHLV